MRRRGTGDRTAWLLAAPGAEAATSRAPGSNARHLSQGRPTAPAQAPVQATANASAGTRAVGASTVLTPTFKCAKPGHSHSIHVTVGLSDLHKSVTYDPKHQLAFALSVTPTFSVRLGFSGDVSCTATDLRASPCLTD